MQVSWDIGQLVAKCVALGLTLQRVGGADMVQHIAVTLQPETMRRDEFDTLCSQQLLWNEAVDNTGRNFLFLFNALRETAESDANFTGRLVNILRDVYLGGSQYQRLMLGVFRADYMRSDTSECDTSCGVAENWKNVEINTISCAFPFLSPLVSDFHRHIAIYLRALRGSKRGGRDDVEAEAQAMRGLIGALERSESANVVTEALAAAVTAWTAQQNFDGLRAVVEEGGRLLQPVVLFVGQVNERNTSDTFGLIFKLLEVHGIISLRRTLQEIHECMTLHDVPNSLPLAVVDGCYPVAVAYFRSAYTPTDFLTEAAWAARHDIERCSAIKCPSIPHHLLTFKKLQQLFCDVENVLIPIAFQGDAKKAHNLRRHFMPQYSLNPAEVGEEAVQRVVDDALQHPERYVMKPQLEGGGNLLSGEAMLEMLRATRDMDPALFDKVRREYVLMSRIDFCIRSGALLVDGKVVQLVNKMCSEVGIYGVILSDGDGGVIRNASAGYLVRSKKADLNDGGVISGIAALDSLALV